MIYFNDFYPSPDSSLILPTSYPPNQNKEKHSNKNPPKSRRNKKPTKKKNNKKKTHSVCFV